MAQGHLQKDARQLPVGMKDDHGLRKGPRHSTCCNVPLLSLGQAAV